VSFAFCSSWGFTDVLFRAPDVLGLKNLEGLDFKARVFLYLVGVKDGSAVGSTDSETG